MIIKAVSLFLIFMLVLGMFGKLRFPKIAKREKKALTAKKCKTCGAINPDGSPCLCTQRGKS